MKKILKMIIPVSMLTIVFTTMILANATSKSGKKIVQNNKDKQVEMEINQLEEELDSLRKKDIKTQKDNVKENQLMEEIAQKEIENGIYDYDYKTDLQRCVNTIEAVVSDCDRIIEAGSDDEQYMKYVKESRKLWKKVVNKYQKILDSDLSADEYKRASENYYKDEEKINKQLEEKYFN